MNKLGPILQFLILCLIGSSLNGQVSLGAKASLSLSFNKSSVIQLDDELDFLTYELKFIEEDLAPSYGLIFIMENHRAFLRADMVYRQINRKFNYINYLNPSDLRPVNVTKKIRSIVVPFQMGFKYDNLKFGAGPVISYTISEPAVLEEIVSLEERQKKLQGGFQVAFSVALNRLVLDLQYEQRFHGVAEEIYYRGDKKSFDQSSRYINLGLAYILPISQ